MRAKALVGGSDGRLTMFESPIGNLRFLKPDGLWILSFRNPRWQRDFSGLTVGRWSQTQKDPKMRGKNEDGKLRQRHLGGNPPIKMQEQLPQRTENLRGGDRYASTRGCPAPLSTYKQTNKFFKKTILIFFEAFTPVSMISHANSLADTNGTTYIG